MPNIPKCVLAVSTALFGATIPGCDCGCNQTGHPKCGTTKYHVSCMLFDASDPSNKQFDDADDEYKFENGQEVTLCKNIKWPGKPSDFQLDEITITCKDNKFTITNPFQSTVTNKSAEMKVSKPERYRGTSREARLWGAVTKCPATQRRVYLWVGIHNLNQSDWANGKTGSSFAQTKSSRRLRKDFSFIGGFY